MNPEVTSSLVPLRPSCGEDGDRIEIGWRVNDAGLPEQWTVVVVRAVDHDTGEPVTVEFWLSPDEARAMATRLWLAAAEGEGVASVLQR